MEFLTLTVEECEGRMMLSKEFDVVDKGTLPKEIWGSSEEICCVGTESADGGLEILAAQEIPVPVVAGAEDIGAELEVLCCWNEKGKRKGRSYQRREVRIKVKLVLGLSLRSRVETFACGFGCP